MRAGHRAPDRIQELVGVHDRQWQRDDDEPRAGPGCDLLPQQPHGAVLAVCDDDLVARPQWNRSRHGVQGRRRVREQDEAFWIGYAHVFRQLPARGCECSGQTTSEELDGIAFERRAQRSLVLQYRTG